MSLAYPPGIGGAASDYVTFMPMKYRAQSQGGAAPAGAGAQGCTLYMPNSSPLIGNDNDWGQGSPGVGPIGAARRDLHLEAVKAIDRIGGQGTATGYVEDTVASATSAAAPHIKNGGNIGRQALMNAVQGISTLTPSQALAMARGKVFNPNVEMLYNMPGFRNFVFNFDFLPRNPGEAQIMNQIILNFKRLSAPLDLENGMFEVPYVWQVKYYTGGAESQYMNKFKPAALTNVSVIANQSVDMHVSHLDGAPIQTTIGLTFKEVEIITRKDHIGGQGY